MPYSFGANSKANLKGVHPDLIKVAERAIAISEQDFSVHDGVRTKAEQQKMVAKGASQTLNSKHLAQADGLGHALDLVPYINGVLRWEWGPIYVIAEAVHRAAGELDVDLVWGGVWDRALRDLPPDRDGLEEAVQGYVKRRRAKKKKAFLDGPHYQLS